MSAGALPGMMIEGETNPPARRPAPEGEAACAKARERVVRFLSGTQGLEEDRALHAHLARCSDCNEHYREVLLAAARVARERRLGGDSSRTELAAVATTTTFARSGKKARWRTAIFPVGVLMVLAGLLGVPGGDHTVAAVLLDGRGHAGGRELDPSRAPVDVQRGDWVRVEPASRVALESQGTRMELDAGSEVLVEDARKLRFRLERGSLDVDGPCTVTGGFGIVEIAKGRARFEIRDGRVEIASRSARLTAVDPLGEHELGPGGNLEIALARP